MPRASSIRRENPYFTVVLIQKSLHKYILVVPTKYVSIVVFISLSMDLKKHGKCMIQTVRKVKEILTDRSIETQYRPVCTERQDSDEKNSTFGFGFGFGFKWRKKEHSSSKIRLPAKRGFKYSVQCGGVWADSLAYPRHSVVFKTQRFGIPVKSNSALYASLENEEFRIWWIIHLGDYKE